MKVQIALINLVYMLKENGHSTKVRTVQDQLSEEQDYDEILIFAIDVMSKLN